MQSKPNAIIIRKNQVTAGNIAAMQNLPWALTIDEHLSDEYAVVLYHSIQRLQSRLPWYTGDILANASDDAEAQLVGISTRHGSDISTMKHIAMRFPVEDRQKYCEGRGDEYALSWSHFKVVHKKWIYSHNGLVYELLDMAKTHRVGSNDFRHVVAALKKSWLNSNLDNDEEKFEMTKTEQQVLHNKQLTEVFEAVCEKWFGQPIPRDMREWVEVNTDKVFRMSFAELQSKTLADLIRERAVELGLQDQDEMEVIVSVVKVRSVE